ncbi:MAG TPA: hypothetical protein VN428_02855, partial [Bryobacteraceae bacterium]|nr:hypothetical protein [Bryobacteraceae bacterium]
MMLHDASLLAAQIILASAVDAVREQGSPARAIRVLRHALAHLERLQLVLAIRFDPRHRPRGRVLPSGKSKVNEL